MRSAVRLMLFVSIVSLVMASPASEEVTGRVVSVNESDIDVRIKSEIPIKVGYEVRLGFDAPEVGFVELPGVWTIRGTLKDDTYRAVPVGSEHGTPQIGHKAKITIIESPDPLDGKHDRGVITFLGDKLPGDGEQLSKNPGSMDPPSSDPRFVDREPLFDRGHRLLFETENSADWAAGFIDLKKAAEMGHVEAIYEVGVAPKLMQS